MNYEQQYPKGIPAKSVGDQAYSRNPRTEDIVMKIKAGMTVLPTMAAGNGDSVLRIGVTGAPPKTGHSEILSTKFLRFRLPFPVG